MSEQMRYWQQKVAELESSGLSRAAFCRRCRINYQTMTSWVKRFREEGEGGGSVRFVEVLPSAVARASAAANVSDVANVSAVAGATPYEVVLGGTRSIRVGGDFDKEVLARLIGVVESC